MKENPNYINGYAKNSNKSSSSWSWKGIQVSKKNKKGKRMSVTEFLEESGRKIEEAVVGPGAGVGAGCGVGLGLGLVGGTGFGGSSWNQLKIVFGVGAGCGVGFGFGYGQGIGFGSTLDSLKDRLLPANTKPKKRVLLQI